MDEGFRLVAGHVALDFANTLDNRHDPDRLLELLPTYERFLAFAAQSRILTRQQVHRLLENTSPTEARGTLERIIEIREALYFLFQAAASHRAPDRQHLRTLNRLLEETRVPEAIVWHKSKFRREYRDLSATPDGPLRPIIDAALTLFTSPNRDRLRECSADTCRWLFLDHSKNHSRRWCEMQICGNRSKSARFHARRRDGQT